MNKTLKESVSETIRYQIENHAVVDYGYEEAAEEAIREVGEHLMATILMKAADGEPIILDRLIKEECGL